ncbi:MAG TPA: CDP-archaeol synthase [Acidimicrobiia bacterium]|nr:CDP-archaeol synthase [Acidimicrobiia bacterium]
MADDTNEVEGVRILGAQEAQELARTPSSSRTSRASRKAAHKAVATSPTEQTSNVDLPHWSDAPTGEVPTTVIDSDAPADGWEALTGSQPRIRVDQNDWKASDYDPDLSLQDDSLSVGALGNDHISLDDNDEEFDRNVAQKRAGTTPVTPASTQVAEPAASLPAAGAPGSASNPINTDTGTQRITKISTVPDSASAVPIEGSDIAQPLDGREPRPRPSSKARREKRQGAAPYASGATADNDSETATPPSEMTTLITRTATAAVMAVIALVCFFLGTIPTLIFVALVITAMSLELCAAFRQIGSKPAALLVGAMSFFSVIAGYLVGDRAIALASVTFFAFAALWYLLGVIRARPVIGLGISALVYLYVGVLGSFAGMILRLENSSGKSIGIFVLVSTVLCVTANDTAAYLFGKYMGRTPLAPEISPNKTMEGTTAGVIASIIVGIFVAYSSSGNLWSDVKGGIILGFLLACASIFGDLIESMLKRDCNLKDFGSILPGHGGLMDRFDGLLFALPVAFYLSLTLL